MKVAIIGSRELTIDNLSEYIPDGCSEIVSGGAKGIDSCAASYALQTGLKLTELKPEYSIYGKNAPLVRNRAIVDYSDIVLAFWDKRSHGTKYVIDYCKKTSKNCIVILL